MGANRADGEGRRTVTEEPGESGTRPASTPVRAVAAKALPDAPPGAVRGQKEPTVTAEPGATAGEPASHLDSAQRPEADVLEQAAVVEVDQIIERGARNDDVAEADWLEQSIEEPLDDERR